jgi:hypothetical protein
VNVQKHVENSEERGNSLIGSDRKSGEEDASVSVPSRGNYDAKEVVAVSNVAQQILGDIETNHIT